jgi:hypothetical protein
MLQIADKLVLETAVDLAGGRRDSMPQEAHHIQALKVAHGVMDKSRIVPLERLGFFEDHIGGVFALGHRPIIMQSGQGGEDLAMERVSLAREFLAQLWPIGEQLSVGQGLGAPRILQGHKAVVGAAVSQALGVHLSSKPRPSI